MVYGVAGLVFQKKFKKILKSPGLMSANFCCNIQMRGSWKHGSIQACINGPRGGVKMWGDSGSIFLDL